MVLNSPTNEISLLTMTIQRQLLKNFGLHHQEMNVYKMRFKKIDETSYHCHITCFLHISATTSCVASTAHVEIALVSSSSSPSSSSPGKLPLLSKQTSYHIFFSDICVEHRTKEFVMRRGKCLGSHEFTTHCQLCILY